VELRLPGLDFDLTGMNMPAPAGCATSSLGPAPSSGIPDVPEYRPSMAASLQRRGVAGPNRLQSFAARAEAPAAELRLPGFDSDLTGMNRPVPAGWISKGLEPVASTRTPAVVASRTAADYAGCQHVLSVPGLQLRFAGVALAAGLAAGKGRRVELRAEPAAAPSAFPQATPLPFRRETAVVHPGPAARARLRVVTGPGRQKGSSPAASQREPRFGAPPVSMRLAPTGNGPHARVNPKPQDFPCGAALLAMPCDFRRLGLRMAALEPVGNKKAG
jgi:hypothetical protein